MAEAEVLEVFRRDNKPFSVQNLCDLLAHLGHKKAAVTRALDALVAAGTIAIKEFGKTRLYIPPQEGLDVLPKEQIDALKQRAADKRREAAASASRARALEAELRALESRPSLQQLDARVRELEAARDELEARAAPLRAGGAALVTPAQRAAAEASLQRCLVEWRRRRGVFRAVWEAVSEGMEGKQSDLYEEMGVETDEAAGASVQEVASLLPKAAGGGGFGGGGGGGGGGSAARAGLGSAKAAPPQQQLAAAAGGGGGPSANKKARAALPRSRLDRDLRIAT